MAFSTVLVVKDPARNDYARFFEAVFTHIPASLPGIDVLVLLPVKQTKELNYVLARLYDQLRGYANKREFSFKFEITVLLESPRDDWDVAFVPLLEAGDVDVADKVIPLEGDITRVEPPSFESFGSRQFLVSAVGGTFDHLHDGHKILLLAAGFVTLKHLIVGVTGPQMLLKKKYAEVMEPIGQRIKAVTKFLQQILPPSVTFAIYQIDDVCGPTGFVKDIDALIISEETRKGADFVNDYRQKQDFPVLEVVSVDVLGATGKEDENWEGKISSTGVREEEVKRLAKRQKRH